MTHDDVGLCMATAVIHTIHFLKTIQKRKKKAPLLGGSFGPVQVLTCGCVSVAQITKNFNNILPFSALNSHSKRKETAKSMLLKI